QCCMDPLKNQTTIAIWESSPKPTTKASFTTLSIPLAFTDFYSLLKNAALIGKDDLFSVGDSVKWSLYSFSFFYQILQQAILLPYFYQHLPLHITDIQMFLRPKDKQKIMQLGHNIPPLCNHGSLSEKQLPNNSRTAILETVFTQSASCFQHHFDSSMSTRESSPLNHYEITGNIGECHMDRTDPSEETNSYVPSIIANAQYQFGVRLQEPSNEEENKWYLQCLLRITSNPDQTVEWTLQDIENEVPKQDNTTPSISETQIHSVIEYMTSMSNTLRFHPEIFKEYKVQFSTKEAFLFLKKDVKKLQQIGFWTQLPPWWENMRTEQSLQIQIDPLAFPSPKTSHKQPVEDLLQCRITAYLDEIELTEKDIQALSEQKEPFMKIHQNWVYINPKKIRSSLSLLQSKKPAIPIKTLLAMSLGIEKTWEEIPIHSIAFNQEIENFKTLLHHPQNIPLLAQPENMKGTLRHYQTVGFSWIQFLYQWGFGVCLADDMGLGKTIQTLAFLQRRLQSGPSSPVLLICPTSVMNHWKNEIKQFTPSISAYIHHGPNRKKDQDFLAAIQDFNIVITSYQILYRDYSFLKKIPWEIVIADEAQNIKNPVTLQSKAARHLHADFKLALTGTPLENHIGDLWSIMDFMNPGFVGSRKYFHEHFFKPIHIAKDEQRLKTLKAMTSPFILRREKTDEQIAPDLPKKIETKEYCLLTKEQVRLYKALTEQVKNDLDTKTGMQRKGCILAAFTKLKQICNHPSQYNKKKGPYENRSGKLIRLCEILETIRNQQENVLIFTQYAQMGSILYEYFHQKYHDPVYYICGATPKPKRDEMIDAFQQYKGGSQIFILSLKTGGVGITLTNANHVVHYDRWWNPAVENQATDRAFRIGQYKNVLVHKFIVSGTLEEHIDTIIEQKTQLYNQILPSHDQWYTELTNEEIQSIIQLNEELTIE
ncbi:MAG: DEAD/DEAH box helicase, partial [Caldisericia bacterium]|nr:DEAD/DEAH box helicase [Caldisericia bacterium]